MTGALVFSDADASEGAADKPCETVCGDVAQCLIGYTTAVIGRDGRFKAAHSLAVGALDCVGAPCCSPACVSGPMQFGDKAHPDLPVFCQSISAALLGAA